MKLSKALKPEQILFRFQKSDKRSALEELIKFAKVVYGDVVKDLDGLTEDIFMREKIKSTGIGDGIAIAHAETNTVNRVIIVLGICEKGVPYDAIDKKPVHFLFLIAAPSNRRVKYLSLLAGISRLFHHKELRDSVLKVKSAEDVHDRIRLAEEV